MSYIPATVTTHYPGHQQVVVVQQTTSRPTGPRVYDKYAAGQSKGLGITQIVMGVLAIFFNSLAIYFENNGSGEGLSYSGMGIWAGLWFILTGAFGVAASNSKTMCLIVTFMVLSIISVSTWSLAFLGLASAGVGTANNPQCNYYYFYNDCSEKNHGLLAMMSLLLIISLAEFVVAIWSSVICCSAVCCCERSAVTAPVQYITTAQGGQVLVLQNGASGYTIPQGTSFATTNTQIPPGGGYQMPANYQAFQNVQYQTGPLGAPAPAPNPDQQAYSYPPAQSGVVPEPPQYEGGPPPAYAEGTK